MQNRYWTQHLTSELSTPYLLEVLSDMVLIMRSPQQNWTAPFVPESPATHLQLAFRSAVKDLIDQGTSGGIAVLDVAVIMADEADRATLDSVEGSPYPVPQVELMQM